MFEAIFKYEFLQNAFLAALLSSIVCGIIGTIIVEKKLVMMSGGIAHTAFGGIGMGYFLGIEPIFGALLFAGGASVAISTIKRKTNTNADTFIGILWAMGMASGILFIAFTKGYPPDMTSYLFGDILTVTRSDVYMMMFLVLFVLVSVIVFFNYWKSFLFDEEFTFVIGMKNLFFEYFIMLLISITIVVLIRVVGIILVIALLTTPPAIAKLFSKNLKWLMIISSVLGIGFCFFGLYLSYSFNIPSGATIIMTSGTVYVLSILIYKMRSRRIRKTV